MTFTDGDGLRIEATEYSLLIDVRGDGHYYDFRNPDIRKVFNQFIEDWYLGRSLRVVSKTVKFETKVLPQ